jgi:hypothetical protein
MTLNIIEAALDARFGDTPTVAPGPTAVVSPSFFERIALPIVGLGIPVIPLRPKRKNAFLPEWENLASKDLNQIHVWGQQYPDSNAGSVAKATLDGYWVWEVDSLDAGARCEKETGHKIPDTFRVRSRAGRGHLYWKQNARSIAMDNIAQGYVQHTDWSARVNNQYVVSPGSIHPDTGEPYTIVSNAEIIEAPDWLIDWLISQKTTGTVEKTEKVEKGREPDKFEYSENEEREFRQIDVTVDGPKIPYGGHDSTLTSIAGKLHHDNPEWNEDEIATHLIVICEARCENYGTDYRQMCEKIAHSIGKKPVKVDTYKEEVDARAEQDKQAQEQAASQEPEIEKSEAIGYPQFPEWVMHGTSLYDGFVKPTYDSSDKYAQILFMPAVVMFVNYISAGRVRIKNTPIHPNIFLGIIGPYGKFYKSTAVEDSLFYFEMMNFCTKVNSGLKSNEGGKTVIISPGSTEGLGIKLGKLNATHALIYNDELSKFIAKANVENSSLVSDMLSFYEAREYGNQIKRDSQSFGFNAGNYCFSWIWATTDRKFPSLWSKLPGDHVDLDNRMFFLLTPETPRISGQRHTQADIRLGAFETRHRIETAMSFGEYDYTDESMIDQWHRKFADDPRDQALLQTFALYYAIDLNPEFNDKPGLIGPEAVERAAALVEYRRATLKFLDVADVAETAQGRLQKRMIRELRRYGGKMRYREFAHNLDQIGLGSDFFNRALQGLVNWGILLYREAAAGRGAAQKPAMVYLLKNELTSPE